jgi:hypothetical protein
LLLCRLDGSSLVELSPALALRSSGPVNSVLDVGIVGDWVVFVACPATPTSQTFLQCNVYSITAGAVDNRQVRFPGSARVFV